MASEDDRHPNIRSSNHNGFCFNTPGLAPFFLLYTSQLDRGTAKLWDQLSVHWGREVCVCS